MPRIVSGPRLLAVALLSRAAPRCAGPLMIAGGLASATTVPASPLALLGGVLANLRPARAAVAAAARMPVAEPVVLHAEDAWSAAA